MSIATVKAITKRIRLRHGTTEAAAVAAGVSPGVWSTYENADRPETIPLGRLVGMSLTASERSAIASLFEEDCEREARNVLNDAMEAAEASTKMMGVVRLAAEDGELTEAEKRVIRQEALEARSQIDDVLQGVG